MVGVFAPVGLFCFVLLFFEGMKNGLVSCWGLHQVYSYGGVGKGFGRLVSH